MKNYEYIFFDLDGTLSDSAQGIVNSVIYALNSLNIPVDNPENLVKFVGPPLIDSFTHYYGLKEDALDAAIRNFRAYFSEKGILENSMYPGIPQILDELSQGNKKLAVATSKPEDFARIILNRYGIADRFQFIAGSLMDESRIEKHEVIEYALHTLGITDRSSVLMVGDRSHDVIGAAKSSLDCLGVLYGYGDLQELREAGAKYFAETVADIPKIILGA